MKPPRRLQASYVLCEKWREERLLAVASLIVMCVMGWWVVCRSQIQPALNRNKPMGAVALFLIADV
jgi:hypothetical protein